MSASGGNPAADARVDPRRYHESVQGERTEVAVRPPVCLYLEVTNRCNLLCTTCPRTYEDLEPPADMSWDLFTSIVDQVPDLARAVLHGVGEPMLVANLPRMVRYLKDRGVYVLFNTNGTVLSERNGRALIAAGLDELRVSLDASNRESFKAVRGRDYFGRIVRNVRAFRELQEREGHSKPQVSVWLTGLKETVVELPAFVQAGSGDRRQGSLSATTRVFRPIGDWQGAAGSGAVRAPDARRSSLSQASRGSGAFAWHHLQRVGRGVRAGSESEKSRRRLALVALPAALVADVFHGQRPGAAVLYRAVFAAWLRQLHVGQCNAANLAGHLERARVSGLSEGPAFR